VDEEMISRFADTPEPQVQELVARALGRKASTLRRNERNVEALAVWSELIDRYGNTEGTMLRELLTQAMTQKAELLAQHGQHDEAIVLSESLSAQVSTGSDGEQQPLLVARALAAKGMALADADRSEEALVAFDELISSFADAPDPGIREQVALALSNKSGLLAGLGDDEGAKAAYNEMLKSFSEAALTALDTVSAAAAAGAGTLRGREQLVAAQHLKGRVLRDLGRQGEALSTFDELIKCFGDDEAPSIRERVRTVRESSAQIRHDEEDT